MRSFLVVAVHGLVEEQAGLGQVVGEDKEKLALVKRLVKKYSTLLKIGHKSGKVRPL